MNIFHYLVWWYNFRRIFEEKNTRFVPLYEDILDAIDQNDLPPPFTFAPSTIRWTVTLWFFLKNVVFKKNV